MAPIEIVSGSGTSLVFSASAILAPLLVACGSAALYLAQLSPSYAGEPSLWRLALSAPSGWDATSRRCS